MTAATGSLPRPSGGRLGLDRVVDRAQRWDDLRPPTAIDRVHRRSWATTGCRAIEACHLVRVDAGTGPA